MRDKQALTPGDVNVRFKFASNCNSIGHSKVVNKHIGKSTDHVYENKIKE
jgi:hypothetical protein